MEIDCFWDQGEVFHSGSDLLMMTCSTQYCEIYPSCGHKEFPMKRTYLWKERGNWSQLGCVPVVSDFFTLWFITHAPQQEVVGSRLCVIGQAQKSGNSFVINILQMLLLITCRWWTRWTWHIGCWDTYSIRETKIKGCTPRRYEAFLSYPLLMV